MNKTEIIEQLDAMQDALRTLASECEEGAKLLSTIGANAIEDDTLSKEATQVLKDTIINLDRYAGESLQDVIVTLEDIRDEVGA